MSLTFRPVTADDLMSLRDAAPLMRIDSSSAQIYAEFGGWSVVDGEVIAAGGIARSRDGIGTAWTILTRKWRRHAWAITARASLGIEESNFHRIEAVARCDIPGAGRWLERLGFVCEAPRMRKYAPDGDYALYARVR